PTSFSYQWLQCDGEGNDCPPISGATNQTYVVAPGDVGHRLKVSETASNAGGSSSPSTSAASAVILPLPPENTSAPTISGTPQQGQTLTESHGAWTNNPTSFSYQWLQCEGRNNVCQPISGATNQTYVVAPGDVGHRLKVSETASNAGGSSSPSSSAATAVVLPAAPTNTTPPTISGTAQQGQTLTASNGSWTNSPTSFSYQWQRCDTNGANCASISGATTASYLLAATDPGSTIIAAVTASNASAPTPANSAPTAVTKADAAL